MTVKPTISPIVAISLFPFVCDSGISSSTTTKIIAPAANASAYGKIALIDMTAAAPMTAAIGSTMAESWP